MANKTFRGRPACSCLATWLPVFEATIGRSPRWLQLVGDAPASAGFHKGGGSADSEPLSEDELRVARNMGAAGWNRWWANNHHAHLRLNGCPHNTIGQPQVADLNAGRDGTGPLYDNAGAPDNGPRDGVRWPLRTWREGIKWAETQLEEEMSSPKNWDKADWEAFNRNVTQDVTTVLQVERKNGRTIVDNLIQIARKVGVPDAKK